jgi:rhodanese-related sulfurtransferase
MKKGAVFTAVLMILFVAAVPYGFAAAEGEELKFVTTEELKAMMDQGEDFLLINALSPLEFTQTKIKGSVNIPYGKMKQGKAELPSDKEKKLVFYCQGPK